MAKLYLLIKTNENKLENINILTKDSLEATAFTKREQDMEKIVKGKGFKKFSINITSKELTMLKKKIESDWNWDDIEMFVQNKINKLGKLHN